MEVLWPKRLNRTKVLPYYLLLEDCCLTFISLVWIYRGEKYNQWKGLNRLDSLSTKHAEGKILERESEETNSLLTANEVADLLQIHISTVRRWINLGILESCHRGPRGERLFQEKDVIDSMLIFKPYGVPIGLV